MYYTYYIIFYINTYYVLPNPALNRYRMVVRFVRVIRLPACARVSRVSRVCPGSPVSFYRYSTVPAVFLPVPAQYENFPVQFTILYPFRAVS